jgi:hypothetical protein
MTYPRRVYSNKIKNALLELSNGVSPEDVIKRFAESDISKYFDRKIDDKFLRQLSLESKEMASKLPSVDYEPSSAEKDVVLSVYISKIRIEYIFGGFGVILMSLLSGHFFYNKFSWFSYALPFMGLGIFAYLLGSFIGNIMLQKGQGFKTAKHIVAKIHASNRSKIEYWNCLSWRDLELQVAVLFRSKGYSAYATPSIGDKGVDVVATRGGEKVVVQCKQYNKPAQRNIVSELLGVKVAEQAHKAILVCTGGFTKGAEQYALENDIILWGLDELVMESKSDVLNNRTTE